MIMRKEIQKQVHSGKNTVKRKW